MGRKIDLNEEEEEKKQKSDKSENLKEVYVSENQLIQMKLDYTINTIQRLVDLTSEIVEILKTSKEKD